MEKLQQDYFFSKIYPKEDLMGLVANLSGIKFL